MASNLDWPRTSVNAIDRMIAYSWWTGGTGIGNYAITPDELIYGLRDGSNPLRRKVASNVVADIARTVGDLMFSVPPELTISPADAAQDTEIGESADEELDGNGNDHPDTALSPQDAKKATARLRTLMEDSGAWEAFASAAESGSALGGSYIFTTWDTTVADHPIVVTVPATQVDPEFRLGRLVAATICRTVYEQGTTSWFWLQRHEPPGYIDPETGSPRMSAMLFNGLYVSNVKGKLGTPHPDGLAGHPTTAGLPDALEIPGVNHTIWYVPNKLPNPRDPSGAEGVSDCYGSEDLLASLQETYKAIPQDVRLSRKRLVVAKHMLQYGLPGQGASFNTDQEIFTDLNISPAGDGSDAAGITPVDMNLQVGELMDLAERLEQVIISRAGFSPQTFGHNISGSAESGTALRVREGKTIATIGRKRRSWTPVVSEVGETLLAMDAGVFGRDTPVARPAVAWKPVREDPMENATIIETLDRAGALTLDDKVRLANPEMDDEDRAAKVAELREEHAATAAPDPFRTLDPSAPGSTLTSSAASG